MATLQPGEKARMYALGGIARGGAFRGGYVNSRVFVTIDGGQFAPPTEPGHVGIILDSLTIEDELDDTPNTCRFRINGAVPAAGAEVRLTLGSKNSGSPLFAGFALHVRQIYVADKPANIQAEVSAVDYTWLFGFLKVTKRYRNQRASAIARDLVQTYAGANGFTVYGVQELTYVIDEITYTNEDLDAAMTRLARRIGGYWYVDYAKDVHFFIEEIGNGAPETLTPQHRSLDDFVKVADRTQVLTRVYVEGRGTTLLGAVAAGETMIPLTAVDMFVAQDYVFAKLSPQGSEGGATWIGFTGVLPGGAGSLVGPGVGPAGPPTPYLVAAAGLSVGRYLYAYTAVTASGETLPSPIATIDVGTPIPAPTLAPTLAAVVAATGVDVGSHSWGYTYVSAGGETTLSPVSDQLVTQAPITPTGGIYGYNQMLGGVLPPNTAYSYRVTYVGTQGGETTAATYGVSVNTGSLGNNRFQVFVGNGSPPTTDYAAVPPGVTAVKVYRTKAGASNGPWYLAGTCSGASPGVFHFMDTVSDAALGALIPTTNTALARTGTVQVTIPASPSAAIGTVKVYRTPANLTAPYQLVGQATYAGGAASVVYTDTMPDASLGVAAPTSNTAGAESRATDVYNIAVGPAATTARKVYRTIANGSQLKLLTTIADNTTTAINDRTADASLGANAPTGDTSGLQQVPGQVPAGSSMMLVANVTPFEAAGGWAVIGNGEQVIRYTGKIGNTLTGIPATGPGAIVAGVAYNSTVTAAPMLTGLAPLPNALVEGDEIYLVVFRDHVARQAALADMVNVGPGLREEWVQDRRLSMTEAFARADATLALRPLEDVTLTYRCRDLRSASGKTVTVNLPAPTNVQGAYKIQRVTIDHFRPYPTQYPTFTVTASSRLFSFEDWLRRMETTS